MFNRIIGLIAVLAITAWVGMANATLINQGLTTLDTDTNLEWLDLSETLGESYDSIEAGFGGYVTTQGYRFATTAEVETLYTNAGFVLTFGNNWAFDSEIDAALLLHQLMGTTDIGATNTQGFFSTSAKGLTNKNSDTTPTDSAIASVAIQTTESTQDVFTGWGQPAGSSVFLNAADSSVASYLVRDSAPIPEPGTLAIFGIALAALSFVRSKKVQRLHLQ